MLPGDKYGRHVKCRFNASKVGYRAKGVELSQDATAYAKREFGLDVEAAAFEELQFPEDYFDVITLWQVLEHVPHPFLLLKEAHRILKPGDCWWHQLRIWKEYQQGFCIESGGI